jgi:hypothetical protein
MCPSSPAAVILKKLLDMTLTCLVLFILNFLSFFFGQKQIDKLPEEGHIRRTGPTKAGAIAGNA